MRLSFKYRLFTNSNQERELGIALETHRRLYNTCLDLRQLAWEQYKVSVTYGDCSRWFKAQRRSNPYFTRLNFSSAQGTMRRLDKAFVNFFRRVQKGDKPGYPRFKGRNFFNSIDFPSYRNGICLKNGKLYVQHVGTIRIKLHRPIEGKIKTVTLKREADRWFAIFSCELPDVPLVEGKPAVGIDMGLTHFLTTSTGERESNPRYLRTALPRLRREQRSLCRKKKGGSNRRKQRLKLAKVHARIRDLRREHHHQTALKLVRRHGTVVVESLNVQGMLRNHSLSRAIADAGWSNFLNILKGKAEKAGVRVIEVDPRWTSQNCSGCQQEVRKDLSVRWHDCPHCGLSLDRDYNAALNILARGLARTGPAEANVNHKVKRPPRSRRLQATE